MNERGTHCATILPQGISKLLLNMRIGVRLVVRCLTRQPPGVGVANGAATLRIAGANSAHGA